MENGKVKRFSKIFGNGKAENILRDNRFAGTTERN